MLPLGFCIGTIVGLKELAQERRENMTHKPDAVEPDRVISDRHCVNCGHLYYDHLVAMNTIQTGECKHCRCYHPETASREQLWREVEQLTAELDALRRKAEAGKQAAQIGLDTLIAMRDADYRGNRPTSSESAFHAVKAINKALEGESR